MDNTSVENVQQRSLGEPREILRPIVNQWLRMIDEGKDAKRPFTTIARQCTAFFRKASGFMWKGQFKQDFLPTVSPPKFMVTINKAFELVALFGPYLFWKYPQVKIKPYDPVELDQAIFASEEEFQAYQQEEARENGVRRTRCALMQHYLNYSQKEQPGGGLARHAEMAITEALVKGRSCLWAYAYQPPASERWLTGRKFYSVDNLIIDPDAQDPLLRDAKWIALEHWDTHQDVERKFKLRRGSLKRAAIAESAGHAGAYVSDAANADRRQGKSHDMVRWYEIWSKGGVASRMNAADNAIPTALDGRLHDAFDEIVGDYAYLCVAENIPYPLNCPSNKLRDPVTNEAIASDEEVHAMFAWRSVDYGPEFPCHADDRWPVTVLDFYRDPDCAWPIAPLAPALGELITLNVLISAFVDQAYENRKNIIAYLESEAEQLEKAINSTDNPAFVKLKGVQMKSVSDLIQYLKRPEMNNDLIAAIQYVSELFDKRTGLTEFLYAVTRTQSRSARDVAAKEEKASIRPEKMSQDVAAWLTESAELEKFLAGWTVVGKYIEPLMGRWGAKFWDELIANDDPEIVVREMRATIEANDVRKPNRDRLLANIQDMLQFFLPLAQQYARDTGDTEPINKFLSAIDDALEDKIAPQFGPWRPQPDPEAQQQQQQLAQLEQAKLQAEAAIKQTEAQLKQLDVQKAQMELQGEGQDLQQQQIRSQLEMQLQQMRGELDLNQQEAKNRLDLTTEQRKHVQQMLFSEDEHELKMVQLQREGDVKVDIQRAMAQAKPKTRAATKT